MTEKLRSTDTVASATQTRDSTPWHVLDRDALEAALETSRHGLSREEAAGRLSQFGPNELEQEPPPSIVALLLSQFRSPLIYILLLATVVTLALGEYLDSAIIGAVLILNAVIGFTQERRAETSVRALMGLVAPHARVIRDRQEWDVESRELVPGDLVLLESGARVPADVRLTSATTLMVDESLLTGESVAVLKRTAPLPEEVVLADRVNMAYAGSIVTSGRGLGYVVTTGASTEIGAIATQVREEERAQTPLQHRMNRFAGIVGIAVALFSVLAFGIGIALGESASHMFMVAVALAVATIPEGLPVVFTIALAVGVRRMAQRNAIIRRLPAVETLGSTTTIGSDKTGTLTENRMTVQQIWAGGRTTDVRPEGTGRFDSVETPDPTAVPEEERPLFLTVLTGVLTNESSVARTDGGFEVHGDPTEAALLMAAAGLGLDPEELRAAYPVFAEIPFEPERQYSASIRERDGRHLIFVKGAPERMLAMSSAMLSESGPVPLDVDLIHESAQALASRGLRVLGMAYQTIPHPPQDPDEVSEPSDLIFLGLQGMLDPPRAGVKESIARCNDAGIRVVMITGDHAVTARAIGSDLSIGGPDAAVLTGTDLATMDDDALRQQVRDVSIYARVAPDQKLRVVRALQHHQEVVAVTGDGVNDAPALKAADIGVAMGLSGTDVAREAADMVLADDNFVSITAAVEQGRITFDNVRKVTFFLTGTGAAMPLTILASLVAGWPLPFLPAQLLWLNLVTNGLQDVALAFEPGEPDALDRPPRPRREGILSRLLWERTAISALVLAVGTLALFRWELNRSDSVAQAQTVALTTMVLFQAFQAGNARSEYRSLLRMSPFSNPFLVVTVAAALAIHAAALYLPPTQFVLRVEPIDLDAWVRIVIVAASILVAVELHKLIRRQVVPPAAEPRSVPAPAPEG